MQLPRQTSTTTSSNHFVLVPHLIPTSLLGYLKGLGLMAIAECKGYWLEDRFYLEVESLEQVTEQFINNYEPKPIANPWNKASGFTTKKLLVDQLAETTATRYQRMKKVYQQIKDTLTTLNYEEHKLNPNSSTFSQQAKPIFFPLLASRINDEAFLNWLQAVGVITYRKGEPQIKLNDLLGTGGNVSSIDLAFSYLFCCEQLWNLTDGKSSSDCRILAKAAIEGISLKKSLRKKAILCHLSPISDYYGELNTKTGNSDYPDNGEASTQLSNPVDYILAIEGLLQFSGTKKSLKESDGETPEHAISLYPLLLEVNAGSAETSDRTSQSKHECWLPLWSEPMNLKQYQDLVLEHLRFRLANQIRDTLDLLQALSNSSEYLGFNRYSRFGFWTRKGQGNFAIHIGIVTPGKTDIGSELRQWRARIHQKLNPSNDREQLSNKTYALFFSLEQRLVALQRGQGSLIELLILLGKIEKYLSNVKFQYLLPVPQLSAQWVEKAYQEMPTPEVRLAISLASTTGLRGYISCARYSGDKQAYFWPKDKKPLVPTQSLQAFTMALLAKWSVELSSPPKKYYLICSKLSDIKQLIEGTINESLIIDLACGLSLCKMPKSMWDIESAKDTKNIPLPLAYKYAASLQWNRKLVLNNQSIHALIQGSTVPLERQMYSQGVNFSLPSTVNNGRQIVIALAFPIKPFYYPKD